MNEVQERDFYPLQDKVAIVTGASRGIGRSIALALARNGALVSLAARTEPDLEQVAAEIAALGRAAAVFPTDLRSEPALSALVRGTMDRFGRLDILVNNAGMSNLPKPLLVTTTAEWDEIMETNARAPFILCRETIPYLKRQKQSFIVNIGSVVAYKGYVDQTAYGASKHALLGMSKALAKEVQRDGIRVHAICPGGVDTSLIAMMRPDIPQDALIRPDDVADVVVFLLTHAGNAVIDQVDMHRASSTPWA